MARALVLLLLQPVTKDRGEGCWYDGIGPLNGMEEPLLLTEAYAGAIWYHILVSASIVAGKAHGKQ